MALQTYRFKATGPTNDAIQMLVTGGVIMGTADLPAVDVQVDSSQLADLEEAMKSWGFTLTTGGGGAFQELGSSVLYWPVATPWSAMLTKIGTARPDNGVIVMMGAGAYTMDVAANLDRVSFIGMVESATGFGGTPTTLTMVAPFALLGNFLYLTNIVALSEVTIWDGVGPFRLNLMGSSNLARSYLGVFVPTIKLAVAGVLNVSASQFSLLGGGNDPTVEMSDGSTINFLLNSGGIIGDKTAVLKLGAIAATVTMALDSTCVVAGVNGALGSAFGAGIDATNSVYKNGNAFFGPYAPTTPAHWAPPAPDNIGSALDALGKGLTWRKYTVSYTALSAASLSTNIELFLLPARAVIHSVIIKQQTSFLGGLISSYTLSVGVAGNLAKYAAAFNVLLAPGTTVAQISSVMGFENLSAPVSIRLQAVTLIGLLNAATQGSVDIWVLTSNLPA